MVKEKEGMCSKMEERVEERGVGSVMMKRRELADHQSLVGQSQKRSPRARRDGSQSPN
jgi:hypothetical protein